MSCFVAFHYVIGFLQPKLTILSSVANRLMLGIGSLTKALASFFFYFLLSKVDRIIEKRKKNYKMFLAFHCSLRN